MGKNLKLNIKNAQLAEALKLSQPKKSSLPKPKKADEEAKKKFIGDWNTTVQK